MAYTVRTRRLTILSQVRMNQPSQFAPAISCKAYQGLEIVGQMLDQFTMAIRTIAHPTRRLPGFSSFSRATSKSAVPEDRPEPTDPYLFRSILTVHERISSYAELQELIHNALRIQNPEWIGSDGESDMCEFYEARFAKLLGRENPAVKN
jgi:hypothetical protein